MRNAALACRTFAQARWGLRFGERDALLRWQHSRIERFVRTALPSVLFYRDHAGARLDQLPIVDKATVRSNFAAFNNRGIELERALDVALAAERDRDFAPTIGGVTVGLSSGTSGARSVFLVSAQERHRWAGLVLARLLTSSSLGQIIEPWRPPLRIAFFLRANSNLYESVKSRRIRFAFYDLTEPFDEHVRRLNAGAPHVLVAPPTVLRRLAGAALEGVLRIVPAQVVSVAEVLEPDDRTVIGRAFGVPIQEVYQASEGFLGVTCPAGRLHLNEEFLHVEPEWLDDDHRLFRPIVTDFTRTCQFVVRYRLDDVLRAADGPCPCGRVARSLEAVEGRSDEVLWWPSMRDGDARPVFPDVVRRSMALAGVAINDYRIEQRGPVWAVGLDTSAVHEGAARAAVRHELDALCVRLGLQPPALRFEPWTPWPPLAKRRRIRCVERPALREVVA
jgi:putative adenylate-forming enzyme